MSEVVSEVGVDVRARAVDAVARAHPGWKDDPRTYGCVREQDVNDACIAAATVYVDALAGAGLRVVAEREGALQDGDRRSSVARVLAAHMVRYSSLTEQDHCATCGDLTLVFAVRADGAAERAWAHQADMLAGAGLLGGEPLDGDEVPAEVVERASHALHEKVWQGHEVVPMWQGEPEQYRERIREDVRCVLAAASVGGGAAWCEHNAPGAEGPAVSDGVSVDGDAEGALREAMTDVLAVADVPDEDAPTALLACLRELGWVLTPVVPGVRVERDELVAFLANEGDGGIWEHVDRANAEVLADAVVGFYAAHADEPSERGSREPEGDDVGGAGVSQFEYGMRLAVADPDGYYLTRWDLAKRVTVQAGSEKEAAAKAAALLGDPRRMGSWARKPYWVYQCDTVRAVQR